MKKDVLECNECNNIYIVATKSKDEILYCPFCGEENKKPVEDNDD